MIEEEVQYDLIWLEDVQVQLPLAHSQQYQPHLRCQFLAWRQASHAYVQHSVRAWASPQTQSRIASDAVTTGAAGRVVADGVSLFGPRNHLSFQEARPVSAYANLSRSASSAVLSFG